MQGAHLLLEEPIRMASILEPSKTNFFPAMTKIVGTLGPNSRSVEVIEGCLRAGMSVARFDFSDGDYDYHQETLENLKTAVKKVRKLCAVMLDTVGAELQVVNKSQQAIVLEMDAFVTLTPDQSKEASSEVLPINFGGLAKVVRKGDTIFVGQYLFTGSETTSVWLEVADIRGQDVICIVKNSSTLAGSLFTMHVSQVHIDLPTLSDADKHVIATWGVRNNIDFISLSYTRHAEDIRQTRAYLAELGNLQETQIFAKIENVEGLEHFDEILQEADGIILSRGNLGIDLPPEKVFLFQKAAVHKCNMVGKPAVITRVVDSMTDNLRPTRAEATDVANAVLDGTDAILLGAETFRGLYPFETISTVGRICAEAEKVYNQAVYFKKTLKCQSEPMSHLECIATSAVSAAIKVKASVIAVFTTSGRTAKLIAKYRPTMPVISVVIPRLSTNQLKWSFTGAFQARQSLIVRGIFPMLADPRHPAESTSATNESVLTEVGMKVSIEKEMCLEGLERCIHKDLSDRVLVSYGIFPSARPLGSKLVCEVDMIGKEDNFPCKDDTTEFVIQVIAEHGNESFRNHMDVNITEQSTANAEERDCITDLSDLTEHVEGTGGKCESEMQRCDLLEARLNCYLRSGVGTSETSKCINGSLVASIDKLLMKYLEDTGNLKLVVLENIIALSPTAIRTACYAALESIFWSLNSGSLEENVLSSMNRFLEEKSMDLHALKFIKSVGMPLSCGEDVSSVSVRHPNIVPILGLLKSTEYMYLVHPKAPFTLENILHFSPGVLKTDWHLRFLTYQILSALAYSHNQGIAHGGLNPSNILLSDTYWCWLGGFGEHSIQNIQESLKKTNSSIALAHKGNICIKNCSCRALFMELKLSSLMDWESDFKRWWEGELSNYEYLLALNRLAGRRWGDRTFHTVMPWVIDFSVRPDVSSNAGWRDLKKSKWHLAKGDEQLDFTYASSEIPHHVSDECLSELAVCSYKARRLPLCVLRRTVRSVYEPNEYPASMQRLYQWTPDECIPEFYTDPRVFYSIHEGMSDLVIPSWAATPEEFISFHREALESDQVSMSLHHWIDLTFGYKLSGEASVAAKNVTLSTSAPTVPRSMGRRQLFARPHPMRKCSSRRLQNSWKDPPEFGTETKVQECTNESLSKMVRQSVSQTGNICSNNNSFSEVDNLSVPSSLEELEELALFIESSRHLTPCYNPTLATNSNSNMSFHSLLGQKLEKEPTKSLPNTISDAPYGEYRKFLDCLEAEEDGRERTFQDFLLWQNKASQLISPSETLANDIFAMGCIIAELHLHRPLFDPVSLAAYIKDGILPGLLKKLPPYLQSLIESAIHLDWRRRPSAEALLEMPYFPSTVRSAYWFLAPVHIIGSKSSRLQYAAKLAREGALLSMGSFAAEMCVSSCLPLILAPSSDFDVEAAVHLLREFIRSLKPQAAKSLVLPSIQKILQSAESSHLKVTLLQISFIRDLWKSVGLQAYLENIHPLVIKNLYISYDKNSAAAASVLLVGSCEELGTPITIHQTILPLMQCFGRGITVEGIETLVRIGGHLGDKVIVRQMLPPLRSIVLSGAAFSNVDKQEPFQSWHTLAVIDALTVLDGLVRILPSSVVLTELVQEQNSVHAKLLMQNNLNPNLLQPAAKALLAICQHIGPDSTAAFMLPKIKPVLDELAFSQEVDSVEEEMGNHDSSSRMQRVHTNECSEVHEEACANNKMDLVFLLYPSLALLLGIERLRQCFTTWLLMEQVLFRRYKWKWKCVGEMSQIGDITHGISTNKSPQTPFNPASLLLNGVGWSIPQSQASKISKSSITRQAPDDRESAHNEVAVSCGKYEPWSWLPITVDTWEGPESLGRLGGLKDEYPWRLKASVLHSVRAHPGVLRAVAVEDDECTVFSAGTGPRVRGIVYKWQLSTMDCMIGYTGHEEVVNDICILPGCERIASCDGTVHIWSGQTGKRISTFLENSEISSSVGSILPAMPRETVELGTGVNATALSGGILSAGFHGSLYTCMHCMNVEEKLVAGTGNGYLRFIDINVGQQLHLWRCEPLESSFSSLVSAICCSGSRDKLEGKRGLSSSSWIAAGFSSGHCRLLDLKSGSIIAHWRAHDGFVTKLAAVDEHLIVSSSLDRTLRLWDLRRSWPTQLQVFRGHSDGVSSFSIWGHDMLSASGSKIGLSSLSRPYGQQQQQRILPQKLYSADRGIKNLSAISTINVLPFSRLFIVGTEDGYLKVCC